MMNEQTKKALSDFLKDSVYSETEQQDITLFLDGLTEPVNHNHKQPIIASDRQPIIAESVAHNGTLSISCLNDNNEVSQ